MPAASAWKDLRELLQIRQFRRLLTVRLVGQLGDGLLQAGLASFVFFSPERAATPERVALGFALLLLPFSVIGPFAGVLIDRWSRRQVLVIANLARAVTVSAIAALIAAGNAQATLFIAALIALGINRFVLASLGAALPHVVAGPLLVIANAIAPTAGTALTFIGAGLGVAVSTWLGGGDSADAVVVAAAAVMCLAAASLAMLIPVKALGPDIRVRLSLSSAVGDVSRGVIAGFQHLRERKLAGQAMTALGGHRFVFGAITVMSIVLFRNTFYPGQPQAALQALGLSLGMGGTGAVVGAVLTPWATRRFGSRSWMTGLLVLAGTVTAIALPGFSEPAYFAAAFFIGVTAQGLKVSVDTLVQATTDDAFRGRIFTLYDVVFNVAFVIAGLLTALVIPPSGESLAVIVFVAVGYLTLAYWYATRSPRVVLLPPRT